MNDLQERILQANIDEHEKEADYYDIIHTEIFNTYEQDRITRSLCTIMQPYPHKSSILDVGCGTGNITIKLIDMNYTNITSLDLSPAMINQLKKKLTGRSPELLIRDLDTHLETSQDRYTVIIMSSVLHHLPNYLSSLITLSERLCRGGTLYITHEPIPPENETILTRILLNTDYLYHLLRYILLIITGKLVYLNRDCTYSDYHTGEHPIDPGAIENIFEGDTLTLRKYATAKSGYIARLLNHLRYVNSFELSITRKH